MNARLLCNSHGKCQTGRRKIEKESQKNWIFLSWKAPFVAQRIELANVMSNCLFMSISCFCRIKAFPEQGSFVNDGNWKEFLNRKLPIEQDFVDLPQRCKIIVCEGWTWKHKNQSANSLSDGLFIIYYFSFHEPPTQLYASEQCEAVVMGQARGGLLSWSRKNIIDFQRFVLQMA